MLDGFGPVTVHAHIERIRTDRRSIGDGISRSAYATARQSAARAITDIARLDGRVLLHGTAEYPRALLDLEAPPIALWTLGDSRLLADQVAVSVVGTRQSTAYGERVTQRIVASLSRAGATIVSGMATGIDAAAHRATLDAGGRTIAVLGTGVDVPYPASHRSLHRQIVEKGLVVSENPPGRRAGPGCFPQRNRIIAALGRATIVVEAGVKSGALNTAGHVAAMDRTLAAVPGPIDSPSSLGSNLLMRDGAHPITSVDDALALVGLSVVRPAAVVLDGEEQTVWNALARPAASFDVLCARTALPPRLCIEVLSALELRGLVDCDLTGELRRR